MAAQARPQHKIVVDFIVGDFPIDDTMTCFAIIPRRDVSWVFPSFTQPVMAGYATIANTVVRKSRWHPCNARHMAHAALFGRGDMVYRFSGGQATVVTRDTILRYVGVVHACRS